jgi:hypothetical protein
MSHNNNNNGNNNNENTKETEVAQAVAGNKRPPMFDLPSMGMGKNSTNAIKEATKPFFFNVFTLQNVADPTTAAAANSASSTTTATKSLPTAPIANSETGASSSSASSGSVPPMATRDSVLQRLNQKKAAPPRQLTEVEHLVVEMVDNEGKYVMALRQLRKIVDGLSEPPTLLQFGDQKSLSR